MKLQLVILAAAAVFSCDAQARKKKNPKKNPKNARIVSLGPRPYYLVDEMAPSFLKTKLGKLITDRLDHILLMTPL